MDYYTVHDDTNNQIGFAPRSGANKEAVFSGPKPRRVFESTTPADGVVSIWSWVVSSVIVLSFICLWIAIIAEQTSRRRSRGSVSGCQLVLVAVFVILVFATVVNVYLQPVINEFIVGP